MHVENTPTTGASAPATPTADMRSWHLEFDCGGIPFTWRGQALNESAADDLARHDLSAKRHDFHEAAATLTACLEC